MSASRACTRTRKRNPKLPLWTGEVIAREQIPSPKELKLQFSVAKLLKDFCHPDWRYTHFPAGELRDDKTGAKLKRMGLKAGWPDFQLVSPQGLFHALELKRAGENLNDNQEDFAAFCRKNGIPHAVVDSFRDAVTVLNGWGCLRVKFTEVR